MNIVIQKVLRDAGYGSRRAVEELISTGRAAVNGVPARLGDRVDPERDVIAVDGVPLAVHSKKIYLLMHKPTGYVTSRGDTHGRPTVYDVLPGELRNQVWYVGRLDADTEGLLLFTNDGELTQSLTHPSFEHEKEYVVTVDRVPTREQISSLESGVLLDDGMTRPAKVVCSGTDIRLTIHEGKKRQVRRMMAAVGLKVLRLVRVRMHHLLLPDDLPAGSWKYISKEEIL